MGEGGQHSIGHLFGKGKLTPGPQVPHLGVRGKDGYGKQAHASLARQLRSGVSRAGPSLSCSQAAAPLIAGIEEDGVKRDPWRAGGGEGWLI